MNLENMVRINDDVLYIAVDIGATKVIAGEAQVLEDNKTSQISVDINPLSITSRLNYDFGEFVKPEVWRPDDAEIPIREGVQGEIVYGRIIEAVNKVIGNVIERNEKDEKEGKPVKWFSEIMIGYCAPGIPTGIPKEKFIAGLAQEDVPLEDISKLNGISWAHNMPTIRGIRERLRNNIFWMSGVQDVYVSQKKSDALSMAMANLNNPLGVFYDQKIENGIIIDAGTGIALADLITVAGKKNIVDYDLKSFKEMGHKKGWEIRMSASELTEILDSDRKIDKKIETDGTISVEFVGSMAHIERRYSAKTGKTILGTEIYERAASGSDAHAEQIVKDAIKALAYIAYDKARVYHEKYKAALDVIALTSHIGKVWNNEKYADTVRNPFIAEFKRLIQNHSGDSEFAANYLDGSELKSKELIKAHEFENANLYGAGAIAHEHYEAKKAA